MMPSRDFLIRQAVLNAAVGRMGFLQKSMSPARYLYLMDYAKFGPDFFSTALFEDIQREFRKLTERNWEPLT
jgi:hypothetical protein